MSASNKSNARVIAPPHAAAVVVGRIVSLADTGAPLVTDSLRPEEPPRAARTTVRISLAQVGCEVALQFIDGDVERPVVVGVLSPEASERAGDRGVSIRADGDTLRLSAKREIVLECGPASITLRRDGKLVLRGTNILSRATGVHRIRGGTVQLN